MRVYKFYIAAENSSNLYERNTPSTEDDVFVFFYFNDSGFKFALATRKVAVGLLFYHMIA